MRQEREKMSSEKDPLFEMIRCVESALRERQTTACKQGKKRKRTIIYRDTFYSVSIGQRLNYVCRNTKPLSDSYKSHVVGDAAHQFSRGEVRLVVIKYYH